MDFRRVKRKLPGKAPRVTLVEGRKVALDNLVEGQGSGIDPSMMISRGKQNLLRFAHLQKGGSLCLLEGVTVRRGLTRKGAGGHDVIVGLSMRTV